MKKILIILILLLLSACTKTDIYVIKNTSRYHISTSYKNKEGMFLSIEIDERYEADNYFKDLGNVKDYVLTVGTYIFRELNNEDDFNLTENNFRLLYGNNIEEIYKYENVTIKTPNNSIYNKIEKGFLSYTEIDFLIPIETKITNKYMVLEFIGPKPETNLIRLNE